MSATVTKLPTAATSFIEVRKSGKLWAVDLVTPCGTKALRTGLMKYAALEPAVAHARDSADRTQRPLKLPRGVKA